MSGENRKAWFIWLRVTTPIRLAFWGSVCPRDLKPAAIRAGACVAAQQPGWARRVCGRPRRTRRVSVVRFQQFFYFSSDLQFKYELSEKIQLNKQNLIFIANTFIIVSKMEHVGLDHSIVRCMWVYKIELKEKW
jgi:hypothetical protein